MFFTASKLFWLVAAPSHLVFFCVLAAAAPLLAGSARAGRVFTLLAALLLLLFGVSPLGTLLLRALESGYARPAWPAHVEGVVVLGNGERADMVRLRGAEETGQQDARALSVFAVARRYPAARIIFTGGSGALGGSGQDSEADAAGFIFDEMGLDPRRLLLEHRARNTAENIAFARALARPKARETWLLATSAAHLPRAMAEATRQGWAMTAWPTDYATLPRGTGVSFNIGANLGATDWAVHEWLGLLAYRFKG